MCTKEEVFTLNRFRYIEGVPIAPYWNDDLVSPTLDILNPKSLDFDIHCEAKKLHPFYFLNNFVKSRSI